MHSSYAGGDSLYSLPECGSPDFLEVIVSDSSESNNDNNLMRRYSSPRMSQPPGERKQQQQQQKKLVKNANATPSQKTRALSSFGSEQGNNVMSALQDRTHDLSNRPTVVCIPVKLVFSRLLEKLNRQPSKSTTKALRDE
ncbi:unnamed protein product [Cochlearia groenlandica]